MMPPFCAKAAPSPTVRMGNALALSKIPRIRGASASLMNRTWHWLKSSEPSDLPHDDGAAATAFLPATSFFSCLAEFGYAE